MNPDDRSSLSVPARSPSGTSPSKPVQSQAAADIVRSQIDAIYQNDPNSTSQPAPTNEPATQTPADEPTHTSYARPTGTVQATSTAAPIQPGPGAVDASSAENPYTRTLSHDSPLKAQDQSWQKYHTAWQTYYQQYYERYYVSQVKAAKRSLNEQAEVHRTAAERLNRQTSDDKTMTQDQAISDLRNSLRNRVRGHAAKVRKSRHFMPIMAAAAVMLVFLFLQYNRVLFAYVEAYVMPGQMDAESIIVSPNSEAAVSSDPKLIIPKIAVDVPIIWDADASSQDSLNTAMNNGVVWFNIQGANAKPGQKGNFVLSGHSANNWTDSGKYKFIFARLEKIQENDVVYINYNSKRYTYKITHTQVVKPTDVTALHIGSDKPYITLITCTPLGTATNRLLVFGEQISPNPDQATASSNNSSGSNTTQMPSNSPTFLEQLFGAR